MRRVLAFTLVAICVINLVVNSDWWRHRPEAYVPHQQCLATEPRATAAERCAHLKPR